MFNAKSKEIYILFEGGMFLGCFETREAAEILCAARHRFKSQGHDIVRFINEKECNLDFLSEALNSGDGVYRP